MSERPTGWVSTAIGDVASIKLGKMLDKTKNRGEPQPYLRNINVRWGDFDLSDLLTMRFTEDELETFAIDDGDLLVCEGGEPGRCAVWNRGATNLKYQKALLRVRFPEGIDPSLIALYVRLFADSGNLQDHFTGTTIKHLPHAAFEKIEIPIPPPGEQRRIVAKLDSLRARSTRARHELDRIPKLIERYKQAILVKAFSGELTADWRAAHGVQDKWGSDTVGALSTGIRYGTAAKCTYEETETAVLRIPNIGKSGILLDDLKYAHFTKAEVAKLALAEGDLLFIRSNGSLGLVGRAAIVTSREAGLLYAGYLIRVRLDQRRIVPRFLLNFFSEPKTRGHIETLAKSTSGVNNINSEQLGAISVPLPTSTEQAEIVRRIDLAFTWLEKIATEHARADHLLPMLDQAILARAFRGELVPQDPNDEPASVLLEGIHAERAGVEQPRRRRGRG